MVRMVKRDETPEEESPGFQSRVQRRPLPLAHALHKLHLADGNNHRRRDSSSQPMPPKWRRQAAYLLKLASSSVRPTSRKNRTANTGTFLRSGTAPLMRLLPHSHICGDRRSSNALRALRNQRQGRARHSCGQRVRNIHRHRHRHEARELCAQPLLPVQQLDR